jgi:hypothetical protein
MPTHYLAVDEASRAVVLVIRGSMSLQVRHVDRFESAPRGSALHRFATTLLPCRTS